MEPRFLVIDLFCGAGGTTQGFTMTGGLVKVIACVNHDPVAIKSHWANHPEVLHFEEDIRTLDLRALVHCVEYYRAEYPNAKLILWASLECTNFSKAKGGLARDPDSRTLADHLSRYVTAIDPDYVQIENVVEFMGWGPLMAKTFKTQEGYLASDVQFIEIEEPLLDAAGKFVYDTITGPDGKFLGEEKRMHFAGNYRASFKGVPASKNAGKDFLRWCREIDSHGYRNEWRQLNAADFGGRTSRNRLFGMFAKPDCPIVWPQATHAKNPVAGSMFGGLKKWNAVRPCLDFSDEGKSIFTRKKPLVEKTLERIYAGLVKFVAGGDDSFLSKYYSGHPDSKNISVDGPAGAFTTTDSHAAVFITQRQGGYPGSRNISIDSVARTLTATGGNQDAVFLVKYNSNSKDGKASAGHSIEKPCPVVATQQRLAMASCVFMFEYYSNGHNLKDIDHPAGTIVTHDRMAKMQVCFLDQQYGNSKPSSVGTVAGSLTVNPKLAMVNCESWLMRYQFSEKGRSVDEPFPTILTSGKQNALMSCTWIMNYYSGSPECRNKPVTDPCNVLRTNNCQALVSVKPVATEFLMNPQYSNKGQSVDNPCFTLIARMDKMPPYLVTTDSGEPIAIRIFPEDSETMRKIKIFMAAYGICDIKMRMLKVIELLKIQGFPPGYKLEGTETDQKKFIGNSVHPLVPMQMSLALDAAVFPHLKMAV